MKLGIPLETVTGETRVACTPEMVKKLRSKGLTVQVAKNAGLLAGFTDQEFIEQGAEIVEQNNALKADIVIKVRKPSAEEVEQMADKALFIGHIETCDDQDPIIEAMHKKEMQILSMERIPRISRAQSMDTLSSQANIAGYRAVIEGVSQYGRFTPMMMTSAGSSKPSKVIVLGVGVAGLQAIATAKRLGADVYAYDIRPETKEQIISVGAKPIELDLGDTGTGEGGYAKELSDEDKAKQQALLEDILAKAHIIITTALIPCRPAPTLVTEAVVKRLRAGSVIVDLAAANGGNCPLTEADKIITKHHVKLIGITNYPALMATDASRYFSQNITKLLELLFTKKDNGEILFDDLSKDEITQAALI